MSDSQALSHHPAPAADKLSSRMAAFLLYTGPAAWFIQLCAGVMLTSWPCFPSMERRLHPIAGYGWTRAAALALLMVCALIAATAGFAACRKLREVEHEGGGGSARLADAGHGRTRFVALWGTILGFGFSAASLVTVVSFLLVPRCLG